MGAVSRGRSATLTRATLYVIYPLLCLRVSFSSHSPSVSVVPPCGLGTAVRYRSVIIVAIGAASSLRSLSILRTGTLNNSFSQTKSKGLLLIYCQLCTTLAVL